MAPPPLVETVSTQELFVVITQATSQIPTEAVQATQRLKQQLELFGTYNALFEIASQREVDTNIRKQSIIQFKNAALSHWRSRRLLADEHRVQIRARCMSYVYEQDDTIAELSKVVIAKIARQDYPANWPTLITDLTTVIRTNLEARYTSLSSSGDPTTALVLRRSLRILHEVLKEFAQVKMMAGMKTMSSIIELLHLELYQHWSTLSQFASQLVPNTINSPRISEDIMITHMVFKCLTKQAQWLMGRADRSGKDEFKVKLPWFHGVFATACGQVQILMELRKNLIAAAPPIDAVGLKIMTQLTKHVRTYGKFFRNLQKSSQEQFVALPNCDHLIMFYWNVITEATNGPRENITDSDTALYPERYLIQAMTLFKDSLSQWSPQKKNGTPGSITLPPEFVSLAVDLLFNRFLPFEDADVEKWEEDPEEWVQNEAKDDEQWDYALRPCAERVLMILCGRYSDTVVPQLVSNFRAIKETPLDSKPAIRQREAIYCAVGRCANKLKDQIAIEEFMDRNLIPEAQEVGTDYKPLKRRIAWLLGRWIYEDCAGPSGKMWEILIHLLQPLGEDSDVVVRLTATTSLRECIDSLQFDMDLFAPWLSQTVSLLVNLLAEVEQLENKKQVARCLNTVIERAELRILPFTSLITNAIPTLWQDAQDNWNFKASLLEMVAALISATKEHSGPLHGIVVPLVRESLAAGEASVNLDSEGLSLWTAALRNATTIQSINGAPGLADIFPLAVSLLNTNLDLLGKIICILESYFLLDAPSIMQFYGLDVCQAFLSALNGSAITLNTRDMLISLSLLVQLTPCNLWGAPFHNSGLFARLLINLTKNECPALILTEHIYLFSRMLIVDDNNVFLTLMRETASQANTPEEPLWVELMNQWWRKFDNMSEPRHRKLAAMGTARLVATLQPVVMSRLIGDIYSLWTDVFAEIGDKAERKLQEGEESDASLNNEWEDEEPHHGFYQDTEGTSEYERRKAVWQVDPVRVHKLNAYIQASMDQAAIGCPGGPSAFQVEFIDKADPDVWEALDKALKQRDPTQ